MRAQKNGTDPEPREVSGSALLPQATRQDVSRHLCFRPCVTPFSAKPVLTRGVSFPLTRRGAEPRMSSGEGRLQTVPRQGEEQLTQRAQRWGRPDARRTTGRDDVAGANQGWEPGAGPGRGGKAVPARGR